MRRRAGLRVARLRRTVRRNVDVRVPCVADGTTRFDLSRHAQSRTVHGAAFPSRPEETDVTWTYHQSTGEIDHDGKIIGRGYAGHQRWKNQPTFEGLVGSGPIPRGRYSIVGHFIDDRVNGNCALRLDPHPHNQMFGRSGFMIHRDDVRQPGGASQGSIVASFATRSEILRSGDRVLEVVP